MLLHPLFEVLGLLIMAFWVTFAGMFMGALCEPKWAKEVMSALVFVCVIVIAWIGYATLLEYYFGQKPLTGH